MSLQWRTSSTFHPCGEPAENCSSPPCEGHQRVAFVRSLSFKVGGTIAAMVPGTQIGNPLLKRELHPPFASDVLRSAQVPKRRERPEHRRARSHHELSRRSYESPASP